jgi:hypothetical protein
MHSESQNNNVTICIFDLKQVGNGFIRTEMFGEKNKAIYQCFSVVISNSALRIEIAHRCCTIYVSS